MPERGTRPDAAVIHQIAQTLCFVKHGDWRYDPGNPRHEKWFRRAERFADALKIHTEHRYGEDGAGSSPGRPTDRPPTAWVRFCAPWVRRS